MSNGNGHGNNFCDPLDDPELAGQFARLVALAGAKGLD